MTSPSDHEQLAASRIQYEWSAPKPRLPEFVASLVAEGKKAGAVDEVTFAEWLCYERQHFGRLETDSDSDEFRAEVAWNQAVKWWGEHV